MDLQSVSEAKEPLVRLQSTVLIAIDRAIPWILIRSLWASWIQIKSNARRPRRRRWCRAGIVVKGRHSRRRGSMAIVVVLQKTRRSCGRSSLYRAGSVVYWFWCWAARSSPSPLVFSLLTRDRDQGDTKGGVLPLPLPRFISSFNSLEKLKNESRVLEMK